jgi:hypothetical protein
MDREQLDGMVRSGSLARIGAGAAMLLAPGWMGRSWVGGDAMGPGVKAIVRALGIRDLMLGVGAYLAVEEGRSVRRWVEFGLAADAVDALATLLAARHIPKRNVARVVMVSGSAAGAQAWLLGQLDD